MGHLLQGRSAELQSSFEFFKASSRESRRSANRTLVNRTVSPNPTALHQSSSQLPDEGSDASEPLVAHDTLHMEAMSAATSLADSRKPLLSSPTLKFQRKCNVRS